MNGYENVDYGSVAHGKACDLERKVETLEARIRRLEKTVSELIAILANRSTP